VISQPTLFSITENETTNNETQRSASHPHQPFLGTLNQITRPFLKKMLTDDDHSSASLALGSQAPSSSSSSSSSLNDKVGTARGATEDEDKEQEQRTGTCPPNILAPTIPTVVTVLTASTAATTKHTNKAQQETATNRTLFAAARLLD
jgi:hypothetical protein